MTALASAAKRAKMEQSDWSITIDPIVLQILAAFCRFFPSPVAVSKKSREILCVKKLMFWLEKTMFYPKNSTDYIEIVEGEYCMKLHIGDLTYIWMSWSKSS